MKKKPFILALVPARAGSKRVKNKNIRLLGKHPLISYTIQAALRSKLIDRVIVSTDGASIAKIAKKYGADVPFLRPSEISQSHSTEYEFHQHALDWLKQNEGIIPDVIVNLYPTSPFRTTKSIDKAIKLILENPSADSLRSVRPCSEHPYKMWTPGGIYLKPFVTKKDSASHALAYQLLPKVFIQNASIYITKRTTLIKYKNTIGKKVLMFEMSEEESIDINTPLDFEFASKRLKH